MIFLGFVSNLCNLPCASLILLFLNSDRLFLSLVLRNCFTALWYEPIEDAILESLISIDFSVPFSFIFMTLEILSNFFGTHLLFIFLNAFVFLITVPTETWFFLAISDSDCFDFFAMLRISSDLSRNNFCLAVNPVQDFLWIGIFFFPSCPLSFLLNQLL